MRGIEKFLGGRHVSALDAERVGGWGVRVLRTSSEVADRHVPAIVVRWRYAGVTFGRDAARGSGGCKEATLRSVLSALEVQ